MASRPDRDIEKDYPLPDFIAKLRRLADALESRGNGRLICYDPRGGSTRTILRDRFLHADVGVTGANFLIAETGTSVIVYGAGGVGISAIQGARIAGAAEILAVDMNPQKLEEAKNNKQ